ncbi:MAG: hypothetical protein GF350_07025 [Chitinivibrionales bacterium]|nr:hypothetical protein [Chitinivibrionales bacterium]
MVYKNTSYQQQVFTIEPDGLDYKEFSGAVYGIIEYVKSGTNTKKAERYEEMTYYKLKKTLFCEKR